MEKVIRQFVRLGERLKSLAQRPFPLNRYNAVILKPFRQFRQKNNNKYCWFDEKPYQEWKHQK